MGNKSLHFALQHLVVGGEFQHRVQDSPHLCRVPGFLVLIGQGKQYRGAVSRKTGHAVQVGQRFIDAVAFRINGDDIAVYRHCKLGLPLFKEGLGCIQVFIHGEIALVFPQKMLGQLDGNLGV